MPTEDELEEMLDTFLKDETPIYIRDKVKEELKKQNKDGDSN